LPGKPKALSGRVPGNDFICRFLNVQEAVVRFLDSLNEFFYLLHFV